MEAQNDHNFCVETKGVCFFCFQENENTSNETNDKERHVVAPCNMSLKRLSKYLNLDLRKVFELNIPMQNVNIGLANVIAPLCGECGTVIRKFSRLHHELEVIKMHMLSCVQIIRNKMVKVECELATTSKYRKRWKMSNPVDVIQSGIVDNLRKETTEKCLLKLSRTLPRVKLERLRQANINGTKIITSKRIPVRKWICDCERSGPGEGSKQVRKRLCMIPEKAKCIPRRPCILQSSVMHEDINCRSPKTTSTRAISSSGAEAFSNTPITDPATERQSVSKSNALVNAKVIEDTCESIKTLQQVSLNVEMPPASVAPAISNPTFQRLQEARPPSLSTYVPVSTTAAATATVASPFFPSIPGQSLPKSHENSGRNQIKPGESYDCVHCEEVFRDKSTLRIHVVRSHCEQFFTTLKDRSLSSEEFKSIVYILFKDIAKSHTINSNESSSKSNYSCPHCQVNHESDGDMYAHMFRFHYSDLTSMLLKLQKETISLRRGAVSNLEKAVEREDPTNDSTCTTPSSSFSCYWCRQSYASKRTLSFHEKYNCKKKNNHEIFNETTSSAYQVPSSSNSISSAVAKFHCSYCTKSFQFYHDHRIHMLTSHRIEEFSKYVTSGVTLEQVDTELKRILQTYRKLPENEYSGGCSFCSKVFFKVIELQNHILVGHFDVVVFKLRGLLPQHTLCIKQEETGTINNEVVEVPSTFIPVTQEGVGRCNTPMKASMSTSTCNTVEITKDPLSIDSTVQLDSENSDAVLCQEEEQMKMEWLFSFIDEDEPEGETYSQPIIDADEKGFIMESNDSDSILP